MPTWAIVLTSAAVGALASSIAALIGQMLERRSRRRELALAKAVDLSIARSGLMADLAIKTGGQLTLMDHVELSGTYYNWLRHVLEKGSLPPKATEHLELSKRAEKS